MFTQDVAEVISSYIMFLSHFTARVDMRHITH